MTLNKPTLSDETRELIAFRFGAMVGMSCKSTWTCYGSTYVNADLISPENKKYSLYVTHEYFFENQQEVYNLIKNPYNVDKEGISCIEVQT